MINECRLIFLSCLTYIVDFNVLRVFFLDTRILDLTYNGDCDGIIGDDGITNRIDTNV